MKNFVYIGVFFFSLLVVVGFVGLTRIAIKDLLRSK